MNVYKHPILSINKIEEDLKDNLTPLIIQQILILKYFQSN